MESNQNASGKDCRILCAWCKGGLRLAAVLPRMETSVPAYAQRTGCFGLLSEALNSLLLCEVIPRYPIGWQVADAARIWKISLHQGPCSLVPALPPSPPAQLKVPLTSKIMCDAHQGVTAPPQRYVSRQSGR